MSNDNNKNIIHEIIKINNQFGEYLNNVNNRYQLLIFSIIVFVLLILVVITS